MKVPRYQKQSSITPETGGRMLSVQADPNVFSAPGRAMAQAGQQMFNAGLQWYGHELKLKRASELSTNDQAYQVNSAKIKNELLYGDPANNIAPWNPATVQEEFKNRSTQLRDSLVFNIKDKIVKTRFAASAQTRFVTNSLEVMKISRASLIDKRLGELITEENDLLKELYEHQPGTVAYEEAHLKYFGQEAITKDQWITATEDGAKKFVKRQPQILGMWEKAAEMGLISEADVAKKYIKAGETVALTTLKGHIAAAGTEEDLKQVLADLQDPATAAKLYPNLSKGDADYQMTKLQKAIDTKIREDQRDADKEIREDARLQKVRYRKNATKYTVLIDNFQKDPENNKAPTQSELLLAYENDEIKEPTYNALIARLTNSDAIATNSAMFSDAVTAIRNAETDDDLDDVFDNINSGLGVNGWLRLQQYNTLKSMIDRKQENTPQYQEYEFQKDVLETTLKQTFPINEYTNYPDEDQRLINEAIIMYEQLANPGNPKAISGEEAYKRVIDMVTFGRKKVPPVIIPQQSITKQPKDWTFTDVRAALDELTQKGGSSEEMLEQISRVREIQNYLNSLDDAGDYDGNDRYDFKKTVIVDEVPLKKENEEKELEEIVNEPLKEKDNKKESILMDWPE